MKRRDEDGNIIDAIKFLSHWMIVKLFLSSGSPAIAFTERDAYFDEAGTPTPRAAPDLTSFTRIYPPSKSLKRKKKDWRDETLGDISRDPKVKKKKVSGKEDVKIMTLFPQKSLRVHSDVPVDVPPGVEDADIASSESGEVSQIEEPSVNPPAVGVDDNGKDAGDGPALVPVDARGPLYQLPDGRFYHRRADGQVYGVGMDVPWGKLTGPFGNENASHPGQLSWSMACKHKNHKKCTMIRTNAQLDHDVSKLIAWLLDASNADVGGKDCVTHKKHWEQKYAKPKVAVAKP